MGTHGTAGAKQNVSNVCATPTPTTTAVNLIGLLAIA